MRTLTTAQNAAIASRFYSVHTKVEVYNGAAWIDLTRLNGRNFVRKVSYEEKLDDPCATASVELGLADGYFNLSPLMAGSPVNSAAVLCQAGRQIRIKTATVPHNNPPNPDPTSADWILVFIGTIEAFAVRDDSVTLRCLDQGGALKTAFIEADSAYGDDGGTDDAETVIQAILDDWGGSVVLYTPVSPGWAIRYNKQQRETVLSAIQTIADSIGWSLRYRWRAGTSQFELTFYAPDRAKVAIDLTLTSSDYLSLTWSQDRTDVRNYVQVYYEDSSGNYLSEDAEDPASIAKYGRRWMEITEEITSQIDTSVEAAELALAALSDLSEPKIQADLSIKYRPDVELADLVRLTADNLYWDVNQDVAIVSAKHDISGAMATTTLQLQGQPASRTHKLLTEQADHPKKKYSFTNFLLQSSQGRNDCPNGDMGDYDRQ